MRKSQGKDKELPISEKVKKMFTYNPSYHAQKCYSKLPSRYSNPTHRIIEQNIQKNNDINCEYSTVKEKHFDTNECNDTSSWIAKLVNGIQDEDEENKMFHRLSQIENKSINDLPEDSEDYDCYNEFLLEKQDSLFPQKNKEVQVSEPVFEKETPVTKPMKKSIKQSMIEIEMKENDVGFKVPPVTRDSSITKRENAPKVMPEAQPQKNKSTPRKFETNKSFATVKFRASFMSQKPKSEVKNKASTSLKNNEKTFDELIPKDLPPQAKRSKLNKHEKINSTTECGTNKDSIVSAGTRRQTVRRVRYETEEDNPTRKTSEIEGTYSEEKEELQLHEDYSKEFNMQNLFEEQLQFDYKQCSLGNSEEETPAQGQKRIGSIKKNKTSGHNKENIKAYHSITDIANSKCDTKRTVINEYQYSIQMDSNRNLNNFTLNKRNFEENVLVELSSNRLRSNRCNVLESFDVHEMMLASKQEEIIIPVTNNESGHDKSHVWEYIGREECCEKLNIDVVRELFDKIRLDQTNPILSKNNLKLRGLTEEEKTELGSITTKIHYQNAQYDFEAFSKEFAKINMECSLQGCLNQEKLKRHKINDNEKETVRNRDDQLSNHENEQNEEELSFFEENSNALEISSRVMDHRRKNSNILKKKLLEDINRISYLEEIAKSQLEKNSRVSMASQGIEKKLKERSEDEDSINENDEFITKDPYIEGPSLNDIQLTKRGAPSHRTAASSDHGQECNKINLGFLNNIDNTDEEDGACLIERLNRKLTTYIDKNQIISTYRQFNLNFSELKKHIR